MSFSVESRIRVEALGTARLAMTTALALLSPDMGLAADKARSDTDTIVVTGRHDAPAPSSAKLAAKLADVPQSVTVLDKSLLASQGATSLADALHNVPGITLGAAEGGQIGNNINLNGFTARTDIYLDGFRDRGQYYRDTFALQSVEVLMGPSSMLFGRGSTGGAINQESHRPVLKLQEEVTASVTSNGLARITAGVNMPVAPSSALRIDSMWQSGAPTTRDEMTVKDYGIAPALKIGIDTPTEITLSALLQHNNDRPDYGLPPLNGAPVTVDRNGVYGYADDRTIQDVTTASGAIKHKFSDAAVLRDQVQFNQVDTNAVETAPNSIGTIGPSGFAALTSSATVTPSSTLPFTQLWVRLQSHDRKIHDTSLFNQLEVKAKFKTGGIGHELLIGSEIGRDTYGNQNYYRDGSCNGIALNPMSGNGLYSGYVACEPLLNPPYSSSPSTVPSQLGNLATGRADTLGVYANDTASIGRVKLVGGLRYDRYAATITNSVNAGNTAGNTTLAAASQTVAFTSVRVGAIWQPSKAQSYYASYSTSFNPALEQLTSTTGISAPLPPETNKAYEAGAKWELSHDRLSLTAAAFQITQYNSRSQNSDGTYTANGTIRVRGVRAGALGKINSKWQIFGGYTHLDATIVDAIAVNTLGIVPVNTPRDSATLWSTFDLTRHWQIGGGAAYMAKRYANNTDLVAVGSYIRTDATIAYRQPKYDIRLNVFNLANVHYFDALIPSDGGRSVPGTGRTALLSIVWHL